MLFKSDVKAGITTKIVYTLLESNIPQIQQNLLLKLVNYKIRYNTDKQKPRSDTLERGFFNLMII